MQKNNELLSLEFMKNRQITLTYDQRQRFEYLSKGYAGELEFKNWFDKYCRTSWDLIEDYWFKKGFAKQADFVLLSNFHWIVVDVKNYLGLYEYNNGESRLNGKSMDGDNFLSMKTRTNRIQKIANEINNNIQVTSAMIFINEHSKTNINTIFPVEIIHRNELKLYIETLNPVEPMSDGLLSVIHNKFDRYRTEYPFDYDTLLPNAFNQLQHGIYCKKCLNYQLNIHRYHIHCPHCGTTESKQSAIFRHATELKLLFHKHPEMLKTKYLCDLMGNEISSRTIRKHMNTRFTQVNQSKQTYYKIN
ncbi:nuclease-related domain-containing protein [Fundicoccus culcitae]|uniref:NERD domain-containing protein n=1 Tax=Fundicoccus culcitae TaxID=2969821 RepID=A0ABY5P8S6_9LACT|nr:nuclease-related domain-containing protein [Fundicoccus culcitae]UUX35154.1 NERD domain-containing protein [Fundicoccus culcitae]